MEKKENKKNMKNKWINLAIACGIAVTFATGCASNRKQQPKPNTRDLLRNRDLVPPPFSSPDAVKGFAPAPSAPVAPGMNAEPRRASGPVLPGNVAAQDNVQPAIPGDAPLFVPAQDNGPAPAVTSLFQGNENAQPKMVALSSTAPAAKPGIINRPVRPATYTPPAVQPATGSPKSTTKPAAAASDRTVTVVSGDTLSGIAYRYGITWQSLAAVNGLNESSKLRIGQKLVLPASALATPRPAQSSTGKSAQKTKDATSPKAAPKEGTYVVKAGDSLWTIAKANHIKFSDIQAWNPNIADKPLKIGQVVNIKAQTGTSDKPAVKTDKPESKPEAKKADDKQLPKIVPPVQALPATPAVAPKKETSEKVIGGVDVVTIANTPAASTKQETPAPVTAQPKEENMLSHTVQEGDTLEKIALMYGANTTAEISQKVSEIKAKNPTIQSDKDLKLGMIIRVPYTPVVP